LKKSIRAINNFLRISKWKWRTI